MADLSNLLGDVYGDPGGTPERAPEAPAWADESRLDEAFADWRPEPLEPAVAKAATSAPLDDDLAAALSAALADAPRPTPAPTLERFSHVDADERTEPPVVDAATLEPVAPRVDLDAVDAVFLPPTPVDELVIDPVPVAATRRGFSLSRPRRARSERPAPMAVAEPAFTEPVAPQPATPAAAVVAGRAWQRTDDDILPAGAAGRRGGIQFRLR